MSGDEVFVTMIGAILGLCGLGRWFYFLARFGVGGYGASLSLLPFILLALCFFVLRTWASHDVRDSGTYLSMYLILGAGWLAVSMMLLPLFGLSFRDDAIERKNPAASLAIAGFLAGMTACYSGGNIGDGPGWWVVLFAAGIASAALWSLWAALDRATGLVDRITIDRDIASGFRGAGFFICAGTILGRGVAGDWISVEATLGDFAKAAWPAALVLAAAIGFEKTSRTDYSNSSRSLPLISIATFAIIAIATLAALGGFE